VTLAWSRQNLTNGSQVGLDCIPAYEKPRHSAPAKRDRVVNARTIPKARFDNPCGCTNARLAVFRCGLSDVGFVSARRDGVSFVSVVRLPMFAELPPLATQARR
jgi:hypothetical protein